METAKKIAEWIWEVNALNSAHRWRGMTRQEAAEKIYKIIKDQDLFESQVHPN